MVDKKIELLSPAGSFDCIQAAVNAGANAVYFGVEQLNMRTRSSVGFSLRDIKQVSQFCHNYGVKAYLTLNTVMYDHDMQLLQLILKEAKKYHIDAVIASDIAVMQYCEEWKIPLHVSTQANVSNMAAVQFYSKIADAIVLARELTLLQISEIAREIKRRDLRGPSGRSLKIEAFVHGALCMAISGKCYLSLHTHNAAANRGACVQNCRRPYKVTDIETGEQLVIDGEYIMSPKDLCTIGVLDQIIQSGVDILKIEGRSKGADYVYTVTKCYREAIDAIKEGTYSKEKVQGWEKELSSVFNRGFWDGYYLGHKLAEWTKEPGSISTEKKIYIGKGSRYYPKIEVGEFDIEAGTIKQGDTLMLIGNSHGMVRTKMDMLVVNGKEGNEAKKGDKITFPVTTKVTAGDKLYKIIASGNA